MNRRARILLGGLAAVYLLIVFRAFHVQVLGVRGIRERGERQYCVKIPLLPRRGAILDRTGNELAVSLSTKSVFVQPDKLPSPAKAAAILSRRLSRPQAALRKLFDPDKSFVWVSRQIPSTTADEAVEAVREGLCGGKGDCGIGTVEEPKRFYPNRELAASLIGFTDVDGVGLEGLELALDNSLRGEPGYLMCERDALGRILVPADTPVEVNAAGHSVALTIDRNIQYLAQSELLDTVKRYDARSGTAIVMSPRTGEILAMATVPSFNPNTAARSRPEARRNRAVTDVMEPGSTFKVFTLASALELGTLRMRDRIDCEQGAYRIGGRVIHDTHRHGVLTVPEVFKYSSNIGAVKIAERMDSDRFHEMIRGFGFGSPTGLEWKGEVPGLLPPRDRFTTIRKATVSFGQGIAATPIQLAAAMASVINGGRLMRPYLVREILDPQGRIVYRGEPRELRRTLSPKTSEQMRELLGEAVEEDGTGSQARIEGFRVGGKTGTAQKVEPGTGRYSPRKRVSSFVGFLPLTDPELLILVVIDEPKKEVYGGMVAAPAFNRIAVKTAYYLGISPTDPVRRAVASSAGRPEAGRVPGRGTRTPVSLRGRDTALLMPDLTGLSMGRVVDLMGRFSVNLRMEGSGVAKSQWPRPGTILVPGAECVVTFAQDG
ncbi:MAG: penicillin-binding protein [Deltaproteobacteria bacterium]